MKALRTLVLALALAVLAAACGGDDATEAEPTAAPVDPTEMVTEEMTEEMTEDMASEGMTEEMTEEMTEDMASEEMTETMVTGAEACTTDELVAAVEGGTEEGTLDGMTDDPVATAASNNPVLTTLATAVNEAGLVDTLNSAEALTVFAPTDCAFAELDPATMEAAMADPTGLLAEVLGFHVIPGEQLSAADLATMTELETFSGAMLEITAEGDTMMVGGGQAEVLVPDIQTANATVHLIDAVMMPQ